MSLVNLNKLLRSQFAASVELGFGREYEFATKARAAGVEPVLVRLGNAVSTITAESADEMVGAALAQPQATHAAWKALLSGEHGY